MSAINDAASEMRIGRPTGLEKLKMFFTHPLSKQDSLQAKKLYNQIIQDYEDVVKITDTGRLFKIFYLEIDTSAIPVQKSFISIHIINDSLPTNPVEKRELSDLIYSINNENKQYDLNQISACIFILSHMTGLNFKPFEIYEINEWYNQLKR